MKENSHYSKSQSLFLYGIDIIDTKQEDKDFSRSVSKAKDDKKIDKMSKIDYDNELKRLQEAVNEADHDIDPLIRAEAEKKYMDILNEYEKVVGIGGKVREFKSNSKTVKNRITKAIERAVNELEAHNYDLYNHFKESLHPINTFEPCYRPFKDIDWNF